MEEISKQRLALIPVLAGKHKDKYIGRTALMKYMYFLQTLRNVPLGYNFSLYTYGPFDPDVLFDLNVSVATHVCEATLEQHVGGYGYKIIPKANAETIKTENKEFLDKYKEDIDWLFEKFGEYRSADLELVSTIIYVDREFFEKKAKDENKVLVDTIHGIKPHFSKDKIIEFIEKLSNEGILLSIVQAKK